MPNWIQYCPCNKDSINACWIVVKGTKRDNIWVLRFQILSESAPQNILHQQDQSKRVGWMDNCQNVPPPPLSPSLTVHTRRLLAEYFVAVNEIASLRMSVVPCVTYMLSNILEFFITWAHCIFILNKFSRSS